MDRQILAAITTAQAALTTAQAKHKQATYDLAFMQRKIGRTEADVLKAQHDLDAALAAAQAKAPEAAPQLPGKGK